MDPPENEVDENYVPPLLPSDYESNDENYYGDEDTDTSIQQRQKLIHPEAMPSTVRDIYNIRPQNQTDYMKENID